MWAPGRSCIPRPALPLNGGGDNFILTSSSLRRSSVRAERDRGLPHWVVTHNEVKVLRFRYLFIHSTEY